MKKLLITLIGSFTLAAALPALAGPDWQLIEKARKEKQAASPAETRSVVSGAGTSAAPGNCPVGPLVLPLDHGPRAQTTPSQNAVRKQRYEEHLKACGGMTK